MVDEASIMLVHPLLQTTFSFKCAQVPRELRQLVGWKRKVKEHCQLIVWDCRLILCRDLIDLSVCQGRLPLIIHHTGK